jgi:hypothetical protein
MATGAGGGGGAGFGAGGAAFDRSLSRRRFDPRLLRFDCSFAAGCEAGAAVGAAGAGAGGGVGVGGGVEAAAAGVPPRSNARNVASLTASIELDPKGMGGSGAG